MKKRHWCSIYESTDGSKRKQCRENTRGRIRLDQRNHSLGSGSGSSTLTTARRMSSVSLIQTHFMRTRFHV